MILIIIHLVANEAHYSKSTVTYKENNMKGNPVVSRNGMYFAYISQKMLVDIYFLIDNILLQIYRIFLEIHIHHLY